MRAPNERTESYRDSHADRGDSYDDTLAKSPFDAYMTAWEARRVHELVHRAFPSGLGRCLDFACGTGRMTRVVAPLASETVGVDVSASMLAVARAKVPTATFVEADLTSGSTDLGSFDLVLAFRFFGNAEPELRRAALRAIAARLRPGGYLLVNNHRNPQAILSLLGRAHGADIHMDLTYAKFIRLLHESEFEIQAVRPIAVWQFRPALAAGAGGHPHREEVLEKAFSWKAWARIAPDAVILGSKAGSVARRSSFPFHRSRFAATPGAPHAA